MIPKDGSQLRKSVEHGKESTWSQCSCPHSRGSVSTSTHRREVRPLEETWFPKGAGRTDHSQSPISSLTPFEAAAEGSPHGQCCGVNCICSLKFIC